MLGQKSSRAADRDALVSCRTSIYVFPPLSVLLNALFPSVQESQRERRRGKAADGYRPLVKWWQLEEQENAELHGGRSEEGTAEEEEEEKQYLREQQEQQRQHNEGAASSWDIGA